LQVYQAMQTIQFHLDDPNDPLRIRWTKERDDLPKDRKKLIAEINPYVEAYVKCGAVKSRDDVLELLHSMGYDTPRASKDFITIKKPDWKRGIRLKGAAYKASFSGFIEPSEPEQSEAERLAELQQELDDIDAHRLPYFAKHFRPEKSIRLKKEQDNPKHEPVVAAPVVVSPTDAEPQCFNASYPPYGTPGSRKSKKRMAGGISVPRKHTAEKQSQHSGRCFVKPWHRIRIIDLCEFDNDLQIWAYRAFPHIYVTDLDTRIAHQGTESEWKLAAALAAAKGWEAVRLDCSSMESAKLAIKHHRTFGIEITAITINGIDCKTELSKHELNQLLEKDDEPRNRIIESEGVCDDGAEHGRDIPGDGADTERKQRVGQICGRIADDCRGLRTGQQRSQEANADLSKAIIAVDEVSAAIERWGIPGIK